MIYAVKIEIENDAVTEQEIARILKDLAKKVLNGNTSCSLKDINGNTVGFAGYAQEETDSASLEEAECSAMGYSEKVNDYNSLAEEGY